MLRDHVDPALLEILDTVPSTPSGPLRVSAAEHALAEARSAGSVAAEVMARVQVVEALHHVPDHPDTLIHLAWLRQVIDRPEVVEDPAAHRHVHWLMKWAPTQMLALPQVPLDETERAIDDLEHVYRRSGHALRPVLGFRATLARERQQDDELGRVMTTWAAEPRDDLSDCLACDTAAQGLAWERSDPDRALAAWRPLVDGEHHCTEEPQRALAHAALLRLDADTDHAAALLTAAWRDARSESLNNEAVAYCLLAWTRMGNVDRALPALLERLHWLDEIAAPFDRLTWTSAATAVLDAAAADGLAPEDVGGRPRAEAREEWHRTAADLARAFDERNGTSYYTDRLADWLDLGRVAATPHLPPTRLPRTADAPPRPASIAAHAAALTAETDDFGPGVPDLLAAWLAHRSDLLGVAGSEDETHVALLERRAAAQADDPAVLLDRAEEAARATGDEVTVLRVEADRLDVLGDDGRDRVEELVRIATDLAGRGAHADAGAVWRLAARHASSPPRAEQLALAGADAFRDAGDDARQGLALVEAARAAAHESAHRAAELLARSRVLVGGRPALELLADDTEARLLAGAGRGDDAIELLQRTLSADHPAAYALVPRLLLCDLLTDADRLDDLLPVSDRLLTDATSVRDVLALALGQRFHGLALVAAGRPAEALELLDAALPVITEQAPDLLGPLRWAHGQALTLLGEEAPARTSFAAAATAFEAVDRLHEAGHAQFQAGLRAWDADDPAAAEVHLAAAAGFADDQHDAALFAEASRTRAVVRRQAGLTVDLAELDAVPDAVRRRLEEWGPEVAAPGGPPVDLAELQARVLRNGANLMAEDGRFAEAAIRMESAESAWPDERERPLLHAERGLFLAGADRWAEAETLLRDGLAGLAGEEWDRARHDVVRRWVAMLDDAGRTEDADRIWNELF